MSLAFSSEEFGFAFRSSKSSMHQKPTDETPFCIAILADFGGRGNRGLCETGESLAGRRRIMVDVDNIENLPAKLGVQLHIPIGSGGEVKMQFKELDDFHPDRIFDQLELLQELKAIRNRLQNPATFTEAAGQLQSWITGKPDADKPHAPKADDVSAWSQETNDDMLARLLEKQPGQQPSTSPGLFPSVEAFIRQAVEPYIVPAPDPRQGDLVRQVDQALSGQMRAILHHLDFQRLESAWRTLHFLVSQVETDETLKLYVIDITKAELSADLSSNELQSTGTYRLLVEQSVGTPGAGPWALLLGDYVFDQSEEDVSLLRKLAGVAQAAGAPFLATASPHFAGCESLAAAPDPDDWQCQGHPDLVRQWREFRQSPQSAFIGLALPRFLLRLPYGKNTEPIDQFEFEELTDVPDHNRYLWGNPAAICTYLLAAAFRECGWSLTDGLRCDVTGLPMHVYKTDDQTNVTPCAEIFLTERAMQILIDKGLIPLLSFKGRDTVRVARFQSIAEPPTPLAGRWR